MFNMAYEYWVSGHGPDLANLGFGPNLEVILAVATNIRAQIVFEPIVNTITTKLKVSHVIKPLLVLQAFSSKSFMRITHFVFKFRIICIKSVSIFTIVHQYVKPSHQLRNLRHSKTLWEYTQVIQDWSHITN